MRITDVYFKADILKVNTRSQEEKKKMMDKCLVHTLRARDVQISNDKALALRKYARDDKKTKRMNVNQNENFRRPEKQRYGFRKTIQKKTRFRLPHGSLNVIFGVLDLFILASVHSFCFCLFFHQLIVTPSTSSTCLIYHGGTINFAN